MIFNLSNCIKKCRTKKRILGSLSNDDGVANENGIKAIGLDQLKK